MALVIMLQLFVKQIIYSEFDVKSNDHRPFVDGFNLNRRSYS